MSNILTVDDYAALPIVHGDARIAYGDHADQFVEIFLPNATGPYPTVILIHGGCWRDRYGWEPFGQMARRLADNGLAVWNLEYRRLGSGGGWPATFLDIATGTDRLRTLADEYSLDLNRVVAVGHSAGGHLACWLAGRQALAEDSPLWASNPLSLSGVVGLASLPNLNEAAYRDLCSGAVQELIGGMPENVPDRYQSGSADALLPLGIPHVHIVGDVDSRVPVDYLQTFVDDAKTKGDDASLKTLADVGHFELVVVRSSAWHITEQSIFSMLHG